jgi:putative spermidine/putrescine transport system permease protein
MRHGEPDGVGQGSIARAAPTGPRAGESWRLVLPLALFFSVFVFTPIALLGVVSVYQEPELRTVGIAQYAKFFGDAFNVNILGQTLALALKTTLLAVLIGYPLAYLYTRAPRRIQPVLLLVIVLPLLTSAVVRTFAWIVILGRLGIVNSGLQALGFMDRPLTLLYTPTAVVVALAQIEMPLMVLPIITALLNLDPTLAQASGVLGAGKWRTFWAVTLPLSVPGLLAGCLLVFAAAAGAFVTQTLIGGGRNMFMPMYIYQQGIQVYNYPFAAALAMVLLGSVLVVVTAVNVLARRSRGFVHG